MSPHVVFLVFPSRGLFRRMFSVPVSAFGDEWTQVKRFLEQSGAEYSFSDRGENYVLWAIGTRLGVATGLDGPVWSKYEVIGDSVCADIVGVLCGVSD